MTSGFLYRSDKTLRGCESVQCWSSIHSEENESIKKVFKKVSALILQQWETYDRKKCPHVKNNFWQTSTTHGSDYLFLAATACDLCTAATHACFTETTAVFLSVSSFSNMKQLVRVHLSEDKTQQNSTCPSKSVLLWQSTKLDKPSLWMTVYHPVTAAAATTAGARVTVPLRLPGESDCSLVCVLSPLLSIHRYHLVYAPYSSFTPSLVSLLCHNSLFTPLSNSLPLSLCAPSPLVLVRACWWQSDLWELS